MDQDNGPAPVNLRDLTALAEELKQHSQRLQQLAEELKIREEADAEMRANYPHFKAVVYDLARKHFDLTLEPLPEGKDLETIAREEGAQPLEAFIHEIEQITAAGGEA